MSMKKLLLIVMLSLPVAVTAQQHRQKTKKANIETSEWKYEIAPVSVGSQGNVVVAVWSDSPNPVVAAEQSKKNAVHGVIFKGFPSNGSVPGKKPLVQNSAAEQEHAEYFDNFFADGGPYMRFVTLTGNERDVTKIDKRRYRVGAVVVVNYDNLRRELESQGIVKKLGSGF